MAVSSMNNKNKGSGLTAKEQAQVNGRVKDYLKERHWGVKVPMRD